MLTIKTWRSLLLLHLLTVITWTTIVKFPSEWGLCAHLWHSDDCKKYMSSERPYAPCREVVADESQRRPGYGMQSTHLNPTFSADAAPLFSPYNEFDYDAFLGDLTMITLHFDLTIMTLELELTTTLHQSCQHCPLFKLNGRNSTQHQRRTQIGKSQLNCNKELNRTQIEILLTRLHFWLMVNSTTSYSCGECCCWIELWNWHKLCWIFDANKIYVMTSRSKMQTAKHWNINVVIKVLIVKSTGKYYIIVIYMYFIGRTYHCCI